MKLKKVPVLKNMDYNLFYASGSGSDSESRSTTLEKRGKKYESLKRGEKLKHALLHLSISIVQNAYRYKCLS
jgi:hypothetical protein